MFALAFSFSRILQFQMFDLDKVGQGHWVQISQWYHSLANIKIYKIVLCIFAQSLTVSDI